MMTFRYFIIFFIISAFVLSCDKDDASADSTDAFYDGALTDVSEFDLLGVWAIFNVGFQGDVFEVPVNYLDCGRDFLVFSENSIYTEYLYQSSDCEYEMNSLTWVVENGIITLSNQFQQTEELVVTSVNNDQFTFKGRIDIDDDGSLEIVTFFLQRYEPTEIDIVTPTFTRNQDGAFENLISFVWQPYDGFNQFDRYEIYRSAGDNCTLATAELIYTSTDVSENEFTDLNPVAEQNLCYYLRVYTEQGLLGESYAQTVWTEVIYPTPVNFIEPEVINSSSIQFNWEASEDPYFSHYELSFSNFGSGSGYGQQEYVVATFSNENTTSYVDENPPYLNNPYYVLYVYNIFGNKTSFNNYGVTTSWQVPFERSEIIPYKEVRFFAQDNNEPVVYFYGRESGQSSFNILRFNYQSNEVEAVANVPPQASTSVPMKLIDSGFGKEIVFAQGGELHVYDAANLEFKYVLNPGFNVSTIDDFEFSENGFWIISDNDSVFSFTRDNLNFDLVDEEPHFPNHQGTYNYQIFVLNNSKVLIGHHNESTSYVYDIDANGILTQNQIVDIPIRDDWQDKSAYSSSGGYIINYIENRLYSTDTFSLLESFGEPYNSSGLSLNGNLIFGTNNNPDWQITSESAHLKEAIVYNRTTQQVSTANTIGYPHVVFENYNGEIISISSGLKKQDLRENINNTADMFVEVVSFD